MTKTGERKKKTGLPIPGPDSSCSPPPLAFKCRLLETPVLTAASSKELAFRFGPACFAMLGHKCKASSTHLNWSEPRLQIFHAVPLQAASIAEAATLEIVAAKSNSSSYNAAQCGQASSGGEDISVFKIRPHIEWKDAVENGDVAGEGPGVWRLCGLCFRVVPGWLGP